MAFIADLQFSCFFAAVLPWWTSYRYFGVPDFEPDRCPTSAISGCHVQIAATEGSEYEVFIKQKSIPDVTAKVNMRVEKNVTSGCRTQKSVIEAINPTCQRVQVPG